MYTLLISGNRNFDDYQYLKTRIDRLIKGWKKEDIIIISSGNKGVDTLAEKYAIEHGITFQLYTTNWEKLGKRAGMLNMTEMSEKATHAAFFWDGIIQEIGLLKELAEENNVRTVTFKVKINESSKTKNH